MRSLLVMGSGRSGTSMVTGLFRNAGYYMGFDMLGSSVANLFGYYEDTGITEINNMLLRRMLRWPLVHYIPGWCTPAAHRDGRSLWLAAPRRIRADVENLPLTRLMRAYARKEPFCYKDPRFSVTLPIWRKFLPKDLGCIVVFRHPDQTVDSILRDAKEQYNPPLPVTAKWAYTSWFRNHLRILSEYSVTGDWFFVHYEGVIQGEALKGLSSFSGARVDDGQVDESVSRSALFDSDLSVADKCRNLYRQMCARAERDAGLCG